MGIINIHLVFRERVNQINTFLKQESISLFFHRVLASSRSHLFTYYLLPADSVAAQLLLGFLGRIYQLQFTNRATKSLANLKQARQVGVKGFAISRSLCCHISTPPSNNSTTMRIALFTNHDLNILLRP